jgi:hypothetical protein
MQQRVRGLSENQQAGRRCSSLARLDMLHHPDPSAASPVTHLLIHADRMPPTRARWRRWLHPGDEDAPAPDELVVHDLQGDCVYRRAPLDVDLDLSLPPGTYHVTVRMQSSIRRYSLILAAEEVTELHVGMGR